METVCVTSINNSKLHTDVLLVHCQLRGGWNDVCDINERNQTVVIDAFRFYTGSCKHVYSVEIVSMEMFLCIQLNLAVATLLCLHG